MDQPLGSTRQLGNTLVVSAVGLGCLGMTEARGPTDEAEAVATVQRAIDLGVTLLDTSSAYGAGENEVLLGYAIRGRRDRVRIATRFGLRRDVTEPLRRVIDARPEQVRPACVASIARLKVDHIDLFYLHRVDLAVPIEETVGAMAELVDEGLVGHLGLCEAKAETIRRAHAVHPLAAVQSEYSLFSRDIEVTVLPTLCELKIGLVAYSPLGRGMLTGRIKTRADLTEGDNRLTNPRFRSDNFERNVELGAAVERLAAERGVTAAQLALAWILSKGTQNVPIPGAKRRSHLEENLGALALRLEPDEMRLLESAVPPEAVAGDRQPDMTEVNR